MRGFEHGSRHLLTCWQRLLNSELYPAQWAPTGNGPTAGRRWGTKRPVLPWPMCAPPCSPAGHTEAEQVQELLAELAAPHGVAKPLLVYGAPASGKTAVVRFARAFLLAAHVCR